MAKRLTEEDKYYREQSERQFQAFVIARAKNNGWKYYHPPDNRPVNGKVQQGIVKGFPDLTLVKGSRLVFAELKTETGRVAPEQKEWLSMLEAAGAEVYVWRPSMWKEVNKFFEG